MTKYDTYITKTLQRLDITPNLHGFHYLRSAVYMCIDDFSLVHKVTKELYPDVAKIHGTTSSRVERAIRNAIETRWPIMDKELRYDIFGSDRCPTNSEFIATLAYHIRQSVKLLETKEALSNCIKDLYEELKEEHDGKNT